VTCLCVCSGCDASIFFACRENEQCGDKGRMLCLVELGTAVALTHKSEDAGRQAARDTCALYI
jgi:hypothetical protein